MIRKTSRKRRRPPKDFPFRWVVDAPRFCGRRCEVSGRRVLRLFVLASGWTFDLPV